MSDAATGDEAQASAHDHAWRRTHSAADLSLVVGEYRCDLCPATWSM